MLHRLGPALAESWVHRETIETTDLDAVKTRLGVPADLAACHTAQVAGYLVEGHVPAAALKRLLADKPNATGLAVPGMMVRAARDAEPLWDKSPFISLALGPDPVGRFLLP